MRLCLLCCALLLIGCTGRDNEVPVLPKHNVPQELLQPSRGYEGPHPVNEGLLSDALLAERSGRQQANRKIHSIAEILNGPQ